MLQSQNSSRPSVIANQSRYRVMLLRANGQVALVFMSSNRVRAVRVARKAIEKHLTKLETDWRQIVKCGDRPKMVYIEQWQGNAIYGSWETPRRDKFQFEFHDRRRGRRKDKKDVEKRLKTGSIVDCVLLPEKTRKGGWRAKIVGTRHKGPVTNWQEIPAGLTAGNKVPLKLCGISRQSGNAQFAVPAVEK